MRVSSGASHFAREAVGWLFIGAIVFGGVYFFADLRSVTRAVVEHYAASSDDGSGDGTRVQTNATGGEVRIQAGEGGHFFSQVEVNGRSITAVVDTSTSLPSSVFAFTSPRRSWTRQKRGVSGFSLAT